MATTSHSLSALLKQTTIDDHDAVLKACNISLKQAKGDLQLQHTKFVALLKLDRYDDALRVLEEGGNNLKQKARFERAYALYKVGDLEQAKDIARGIEEERGARHVEAQASYRLENFARAATIYRELAGNQAVFENEENDLRINSGATDAQLEWQRQGYLAQERKPRREDQEAFETAYNAACGSIARGELGQGEVLLKRAKDLCKSLNELSEQEKTAELLPIAVQQLYVLRKLGKTEEAEKLAEEISVQDIPDLSSRQIAQNNKLASASTASNPFLSQRIFESTTTLPKTDTLFRFQAERVQQNGLTLDLLALKTHGVISATSKLLSSSPSISSHTNTLSVINAAAHAQSQLGKLGLKKILPLLEKRPYDVGLVLTIIQLYMLTQNPGSATTVLESLLKRLSEPSFSANQDILHSPGLTATLVSLYSTQNRASQIKSSLAKAASYWRHKSKPPIQLLQAAALSLLSSSSAEHQSLAAQIFSTLHTADPSSRFAIAGYVAGATAHPSPDSPPFPKETDTLTPVARLVAAIDVSALEAAGVPHLPVPASTQLTSRKRALEERPKPAKKRVRKSRLPKDYDPAKTPDPERWLPVRDRASYRPKGRKGRAKAAALTQGGMGEKGADAGGGGKAVGSEGVIKAANPVVVGGAGGKGPQKKQKKKGGKK